MEAPAALLSGSSCFGQLQVCMNACDPYFLPFIPSTGDISPDYIGLGLYEPLAHLTSVPRLPAIVRVSNSPRLSTEKRFQTCFSDSPEKSAVKPSKLSCRIKTPRFITASLLQVTKGQNLPAQDRSRQDTPTPPNTTSYNSEPSRNEGGRGTRLRLWFFLQVIYTAYTQ